jgi:hypothetical protein
MKARYLLLFPKSLVISGFFRGLQYRKVLVLVVAFGRTFKLTCPLYPTGMISRPLMNAIDEAMGRFK